ncbi:MAG: hypothetical protein HOW59_37125 [Nonomuraea sp.]|nr:hypothetical protein [Nonomuraea sp.]NUQ33263.1 hypothetical protein [Dermatophilaceae bacterium]NUR81081.1 hypothetical protein [Dermatophilaceae bacterium]
MNTATLVRDLHWVNDAKLYRLDPPIGLPTGETVEHVVISIGPLTNGDHGTLVVAADEHGEVTSWTPLAAIEANTHDEAIALLGYGARS